MKLNSYVLSKFYYMEEKNMTKEMQFKNIVAQYCEVKPEDMNGDMRFREDPVSYTHLTLPTTSRV